MEPGNKKSAFKLRSGNKPSIAKLAGLENLFGKLQDIGQKAKDFKEKRQSESTINIKQDMEDKIARTRRGESKFQERTRMRKEFNKFKRRNKKRDEKREEFVTKTPTDNIKEVKIKGTPSYDYKGADIKTPETTKAPKAPKINWKTAPKVGTQARTKWYKKHNLKLDDTTPKLQSNKKTKTGYFQGDPEKPNFGATYLNPITKRKYKKKKQGKTLQPSY